MLSAPVEAATAMGQLIGAKIVHTFMSIRAFMSLLPKWSWHKINEFK